MADSVYDLIKLRQSDPSQIPKEDINGVKMIMNVGNIYLFEIPSNRDWKEFQDNFNLDSNFQKGLNRILEKHLGEIEEGYKINVPMDEYIEVHEMESLEKEGEVVERLVDSSFGPLSKLFFRKQIKEVKKGIKSIKKGKRKRNKLSVSRKSDCIELTYHLSNEELDKKLLNDVVSYIQEQVEI